MNDDERRRRSYTIFSPLSLTASPHLFLALLVIPFPSHLPPFLFMLWCYSWAKWPSVSGHGREPKSNDLSFDFLLEKLQLL